MRVRPETLTDRYASTAGGGATRGTRDLALPDPPGASPCPNARRQTMTGAHSTIGRRTTSSESAPTCTPRSGRRPGFSWPAPSPTRPPSRTSGPAAGHIRPTARRCQTHHHARQRHRIRATAQRAGHGHILRRPIQFLAADNNENHNGMIRRHPPKHSRIRMDRRATCGKSSTRSATAPCACSTTAHPSRHSSTNC